MALINRINRINRDCLILSINERKSATKKYRKQLLKRVRSRYSNAPATRKELEERINEMDVDHLHELQLGGMDEVRNLKMLDSSVNRSVGVQIKNALKDLDEGAIINKIEAIE